jgi:hypothetical protein
MTEIPVMATQSVSTMINVVREKTISWTDSSMQEDCSSSVCPESNGILVAVVTGDGSNYAEETEALSTRVWSWRDDTRNNGSECAKRSKPTYKVASDLTSSTILLRRIRRRPRETVV